MHQGFRVESWALASHFSVNPSRQTRDGCTLRPHVHTGVLTLKDATCMPAAASLYTPGLSRPILKNLGFLGSFKKPKKPKELGF